MSSNGASTPESQLESVLPIHPTAVRRASPIVVQSDRTSYSEDYITSKFVNRGADVTVGEGQYIVTPTEKPFEFQTARKVAKTGCVPLSHFLARARVTDAFFVLSRARDASPAS